jgi:hypothetical protein
VPIVLTSRADTAETRIASCVIAALIAHNPTYRFLHSSAQISLTCRRRRCAIGRSSAHRRRNSPKNIFPPPMRRKPVISRLFPKPAGLSANNYI